METMDFFSTCQKMRGIQGDTFDVFRVTVSGMELEGCSMRFVLECKDTPGSIALTKACSHFTAQTSEGFLVQLQSSETSQLSGLYTMHFILTDAESKEYRKLIGTLEVLPSPQEVST